MMPQNNNNCLFANNRLLPMIINKPTFTWEHDKWSTSRTLNVESIYNIWKRNPDTIRVFEDRKLAANPVIMLRKDRFENLLKLVDDFSNGEAFIRHNLEAIVNSIKLVEKLIEKKNTGSDDPLFMAVKNLTHISGTLTSSIEVVMPKKPIKSSEFSKEELEELQRIEEEDRTK